MVLAMRGASRKAVIGLALPVLLAATVPLRAQPADVPPLGEPALSVPAMHRARAVMVIGARRPDHVLTLLAATANTEERSLAAAGATLVAQGAYGPFVAW